MSTTWFDLLQEYLRRQHTNLGDGTIDFPESTGDHPMYGAQLVYEDMGGDKSALDLNAIPDDEQLKAAADLFVFLGGNMETQSWDSNDRQRYSNLIDYYSMQGGLFLFY